MGCSLLVVDFASCQSNRLLHSTAKKLVTWNIENKMDLLLTRTELDIKEQNWIGLINTEFIDKKHTKFVSSKTWTSVLLLLFASQLDLLAAAVVGFVDVDLEKRSSKFDCYTIIIIIISDGQSLFAGFIWMQRWTWTARIFAEQTSTRRNSSLQDAIWPRNYYYYYYHCCLLVVFVELKSWKFITSNEKICWSNFGDFLAAKIHANSIESSDATEISNGKHNIDLLKSSAKCGRKILFYRNFLQIMGPLDCCCCCCCSIAGRFCQLAAISNVWRNRNRSGIGEILENFAQKWGQTTVDVEFEFIRYQLAQLWLLFSPFGSSNGNNIAPVYCCFRFENFAPPTTTATAATQWSSSKVLIWATTDADATLIWVCSLDFCLIRHNLASNFASKTRIRSSEFRIRLADVNWTTNLAAFWPKLHWTWTN